MNVFILSTGRCGSMTFARACDKITNYTSAHESLGGNLGEARLNYADMHIESDNRLSWILGRLDRKYGNDAIYVHLRRNDLKTAQSYARRHKRGIMRAYREKIATLGSAKADPLAVALDYCDTVNTNIALFLRDKTRKMDFSMERGREDFVKFWELIGAQGDLDAALAEWDVAHNAGQTWWDKFKKRFSRA